MYNRTKILVKTCMTNRTRCWTEKAVFRIDCNMRPYNYGYFIPLRQQLIILTVWSEIILVHFSSLVPFMLEPDGLVPHFVSDVSYMLRHAQGVIYCFCRMYSGWDAMREDDRTAVCGISNDIWNDEYGRMSSWWKPFIDALRQADSISIK